jgi:hypothetical protein
VKNEDCLARGQALSNNVPTTIMDHYFLAQGVVVATLRIQVVIVNEVLSVSSYWYINSSTSSNRRRRLAWRRDIGGIRHWGAVEGSRGTIRDEAVDDMVWKMYASLGMPKNNCTGLFRTVQYGFLVFSFRIQTEGALLTPRKPAHLRLTRVGHKVSRVHPVATFDLYRFYPTRVAFVSTLRFGLI